MKNLVVTAALFVSTVTAAPVFTLSPPGGAISGLPGASAGWGFALTSDSSAWLSVTGSLLLTESNPALGTYADYIGALGGPVNFALPPGDPAWTLAFDSINLLGTGVFDIDPFANPGDTNSGTLRVIAERYSADPSICGSACLIDTLVFDTPFSVTASAVPEPSTAFLTMTGLLGLARLLGRKSHSAAPRWLESHVRTNVQRR